MKTERYVWVLAFFLAGFVFIGCNRRAEDSSTQVTASPTPYEAVPLTVEKIDSPTGLDSREPNLYATADGRIILSWVQKISEKRYALRFAMRHAEGWSGPGTVAEGDNWFINWADFPSVVAFPDGSLAAHWLVKTGQGTYAYDVNIALSKDAGKSWSRPIVPHSDKTETEHGFASLVPLTNGRLGAVWVDGRNFAGMQNHQGPMSSSMTLRYATVDPDGKVADEAIIDERICECCQTSAALTSEGVIVAYRDRSENEVRDIYIVRQQGGSWSVPRSVHDDGWEIAACPVNGPALAAEGRRVAIAWYTEANEKPRVQIAFSTDAGAVFGDPVQVDDGNPVGRVGLSLLPDGSALVSWLSGSPEKGEIKTRRIFPDGALGSTVFVAESDIARSSGFPRLARLGNEVLFAWTEFGNPSRVRTARARLNR